MMVLPTPCLLVSKENDHIGKDGPNLLEKLRRMFDGVARDEGSSLHNKKILPRPGQGDPHQKSSRLLD